MCASLSKVALKLRSGVPLKSSMSIGILQPHSSA